MLMLTAEQRDIIYSESENIYVSARAGTGKTTTLVEFVKLRKKDKFLYIVYNNAIKEEAISKFPQNTTVHTIHSLAYQEVGNEYNEKLKNDLKVEDILNKATYFKEKDLEDKENHKIAMSVKKILNEYFNSDKESIEDITENKLMISICSQYWNEMKNKENKDIQITHEGYLKIYQLSKPKLDFDYIMVDEAQDSNAAMLDIIFRQESKKVFVGDPHQKIYGFRGAVNIFSMEKYMSIENCERFTLTESFRFGPAIAGVANAILETFKGEKDLIKGVEHRNSQICEIDKDCQYTIITRTNAHLIDIAIEAARKNQGLWIVGGEKQIINHIMDGYYLYKGQKDLIKNEYLKTIKNYNHLKILAETLKNPEQLLLVYLIEKYGETLIDNVELIRRNIKGKKSADIILTTAHKSKGLEFVSVVIANDFATLFKDNGEQNELIEAEEINLIYVAVTRATHDLELNRDLRKLKEYF